MHFLLSLLYGLTSITTPSLSLEAESVVYFPGSCPTSYVPLTAAYARYPIGADVSIPVGTTGGDHQVYISGWNHTIDAQPSYYAFTPCPKSLTTDSYVPLEEALLLADNISRTDVDYKLTIGYIQLNLDTLTTAQANDVELLTTRFEALYNYTKMNLKLLNYTLQNLRTSYQDLVIQQHQNVQNITIQINTLANVTLFQNRQVEELLENIQTVTSQYQALETIASEYENADFEMFFLGFEGGLFAGFLMSCFSSISLVRCYMAPIKEDTIMKYKKEIPLFPEKKESTDMKCPLCMC